MKPFLYIAIFTLFTSFFPYANAQVVTYPLPDPAISGGRPLMDVISERHSSRTFSSNPIDDQTLSEVLYAAYGVSHDQVKRTIPMAKGQNTMNIYVFRNDGVWLYNPLQQNLSQVSPNDMRSIFNTQDYAYNVPVQLLYTGPNNSYSLMEAGSAYQNVGLYAASRGLNNIVRAYFDKKQAAQILNINEDEVIISQAIGWPQWQD